MKKVKNCNCDAPLPRMDDCLPCPLTIEDARQELKQQSDSVRAELAKLEKEYRALSSEERNSEHGIELRKLIKEAIGTLKVNSFNSYKLKNT